MILAEIFCYFVYPCSRSKSASTARAMEFFSMSLLYLSFESLKENDNLLSWNKLRSQPLQLNTVKCCTNEGASLISYGTTSNMSCTIISLSSTIGKTFILVAV
jgi:hypothetical protein